MLRDDRFEPDGSIKFECIIKDPAAAAKFVSEADAEDRGLSANGRYAIKKYFEWRTEMERLRQIEKDYYKLQAEAARLRQFVAGAAAPGGLVGPDFRPTSARPGLQENAG